MMPRPATRQELERVHNRSFVDAIFATSGLPVRLDEDTFTSPESSDVALLAAGAAVQAALHAVEHHEPAFALVRPPGHHAERDRAMGFCLYNNVAVAAAAALAAGVERVAIVDIDVHHGNGTQAIFYGDPRVLYVSTHQYPFYPGTGAAEEVGRAAGRGFTVNVPLEAGATDGDYDVVHQRLIQPVLDAFAPPLTIVSAGYDAHEQDPLASMRMTSRGYGVIVSRLKEVSERHGVVALVTEGGYALEALRECLETSIAVLASEAPPETVNPSAVSPRAERAIAAVGAAQAPFWRGI